MPTSPLESLAAQALSRRSFLAFSGLGAGAAALLLAGCAPQGSTVASTGGGTGVLTFVDPEIPTSAQVQESGTWQTRGLIQNLTDRLINRNPSTLELEPWIAESWTRSADGLDYAFVIREGVTYSDGSDLDVENVKKNLEWQVSGDTENGVSANAQFPKKITVTTDAATRTVNVHLDEPFAPFLNILTSWSAGLVATATIDAKHDAQVDYTHLIGSGPFATVSADYARKYVFERRDDYAWGPASAAAKGRAKVAQLVWIPTEDDAVRLGSLQSGQAQALRYVEPHEETKLAKQGYTVTSGTGVGLSNQWFLRLTTAPLDDIEVRRALFRSIDRTTILKQIYTDNWSAATSVLAPKTFGYTDVSAAFSYDPDEAESHLTTAGWSGVDADGYRTKGGSRLQLLTYVDVYDTTANALFQNIQAQWKQLGIELKLKTLDYASYWTKAFADPKVGFLRVGWPHPDPSVGLREYYSADGSDLLGLKGSDTVLQQLLDDQVRATDEEERKALIEQTQRHLVTDNAYVLPILNDSQVFITRPKTEGLQLTDGALPLFSTVAVS